MPAFSNKEYEWFIYSNDPNGHWSKCHRSVLTIWAVCDRRGSLLSLLAREPDLGRESSHKLWVLPFPIEQRWSRPSSSDKTKLQISLPRPSCALIKIGSQGIYNYFAFLVALCKYLWLWEESSEYKLDLILVHKNILLELKLTCSIGLEINCFQPSSYSIIWVKFQRKKSNWKTSQGMTPQV